MQALLSGQPQPLVLVEAPGGGRVWEGGRGGGGEGLVMVRVVMMMVMAMVAGVCAV